VSTSAGDSTTSPVVQSTTSAHIQSGKLDSYFLLFSTKILSEMFSSEYSKVSNGEEKIPNGTE